MSLYEQNSRLFNSLNFVHKVTFLIWTIVWTSWQFHYMLKIWKFWETSTTSLPSQHVQCFRQTLQLLFPLNMCNAFVKLYNFSSLSICSMLSSNSTTSLPSQHVQCFRQSLQLLFPLNMFNAFVKLYNFSFLSTCSMLSSNSTTSLPSQHVEREEKL